MVHNYGVENTPRAHIPSNWVISRPSGSNAGMSSWGTENKHLLEENLEECKYAPTCAPRIASPERCLDEANGSINNSIIIIAEERDINTWVWALPLATAKVGGGAPVSYHHHTSIFIVFLSLILLVIS